MFAACSDMIAVSLIGGFSLVVIVWRSEDFKN